MAFQEGGRPAVVYVPLSEKVNAFRESVHGGRAMALEEATSHESSIMGAVAVFAYFVSTSSFAFLDWQAETLDDDPTLWPLILVAISASAPAATASTYAYVVKLKRTGLTAFKRGAQAGRGENERIHAQ